MAQGDFSSKLNYLYFEIKRVEDFLDFPYDTALYPC